MTTTNKYQLAKIYKIISYSHPDLVYFGATIDGLAHRLAKHRYVKELAKKNTVNQIINCGDAVIVLVELYPCNSKEELNKKKAEYVLNNKCVNKAVFGVKSKEVQAMEKKEYHKRFLAKQYIESGCKVVHCKCGVSHVLDWTSGHVKTPKHLLYLSEETNINA